jgi:hypothetical protein
MAVTRRALVSAVLLVLAACTNGDGAQPAAPAPPGAPAGPGPSAPSTVAPTTARPTTPPPATAPACPATPDRAQPDPARPRYRLTLDVRPGEGLVSGTTDVRFTPDKPVDRLVFRLWANGPRPQQGGGGIDVSDVTVDGRPAQTSLDDPTTLVVPLGRTLAAGGSVEARVPWRLRLPTGSRDRISLDGEAVRLGSFFPILPWEPGFGWNTDIPTGAFAEASTAPVADFDVTVTVPEGFTALVSGVQDRPGHWTATAMRDVGISVGRFTLATGTAMAPGPVEVTVGVHQGITESADRYLAKVLAVMADFGKRFGPYPWPTFSLGITPNVGGGIEYPGHVMQSPGTIGSITSHEVAHQWFYGLVGNNQGRDPWLDEGLASWGEARYEATLDRFLTAPMPPAAAGKLGQPMTFWADQQAIYSLGVYVQGVQALAALGSPDLVDCALRTYTAVFAHRIARPADLVAALHAAFPDAPAVLARYGAGVS